MQLVVAVDCVSTPAGVFAAAVAYPFGKPEPMFRYKDGRKAERLRPWLTTAQRLPDYLRTAVVTYIKKSSICYVVLRTNETELDAAATKTLARLTERLRHEGHIKAPEDMRVIAFTRSQFAGAVLTSLTTYARTAEYPWYLGAANLLASAAHDDEDSWSPK